MNTTPHPSASIAQVPGFEAILHRLLQAYHHAELAFQVNAAHAEEVATVADDARGALIDLINDFVAAQAALAPRANTPPAEEAHIPRSAQPLPRC
jgi:hypothetical protein